MDIVVIGGGVIGTSIAWRASQAGHQVTVVDDHRGAAASHHGAGMLAPVTEAHFGEERLLRLNLAAAAMWPDFAAEVEESSGRSIGFRTEGTLAVARDTDDLRFLEELRHYQLELGLDVERLRARECRRTEPMLAPDIRGGILVTGDHQVQTRALNAALRLLATRLGTDLVDAQVTSLATAGEAVTGVVTADGATVHGDIVVLAAGCWSREIGGLPPGTEPPVRPVKGQILRLQGPVDEPLLGRTVRAVVRGRTVYLVPRSDGRIVVGATMEEQGFDTRLTVRGVADLLTDAVDVVPALGEVDLVEASVGLRPGSPDNAPIIGPGPLDGLVYATGHFRNGILLTPITAAAVASMVSGHPSPEEVTGFGPDRFW